MSTIRKLEDLNVWKEARFLCKEIYALTNNFPRSEEYNIKKHLRESARGTASNIGEGFGRYHYRESLKFYGIAKGCLNEVKSDLYISGDLEIISQENLEKFLKQVNKIEAMLNGLANSTVMNIKNNI